MAKLSNQEIADDFFNYNKEVASVFICGGYPFKSENAANLYAKSGIKGSKVSSFTRATITKNTASKPVTVKLDRLSKADLVKAATLKGIRPEENATKADIIAMIEAADKSKDTL